MAVALWRVRYLRFYSLPAASLFKFVYFSFLKQRNFVRLVGCNSNASTQIDFTMMEILCIIRHIALTHVKSSVCMQFVVKHT